jgi:hypothetical protein
VVGDANLVTIIRALGRGDSDLALRSLRATPELARRRLARVDEFFCEECHAQFYEGDTLLHAAACSYDRLSASELVAAGADVRARNRRGAEPLHAAVTGAPGSIDWNPARQVEVITFLIGVGADPNARAAGGVTPLHRAVRNRCSAAVRALLEAGADPHCTNDSGSTALMLAGWTTGRGGTGSAEAKAEQEEIVRLLTDAGA